MGIQNRDYYRNEATAGGWSGSPGQSMCQILIIVTVVTYFLQMIITVPHRTSVAEMIASLPAEDRQELRDMLKNGRQAELEAMAEQFTSVHYESLLQEWGELDPGKVSQGQVWRLLTYAFLHDRYGLMHLIFNMFALYLFGPAIEDLIGRREFLLFYLVSAIASGLCHVLFGFVMHDFVPAIGASGAVMAVTMLFAIYYPTAPINIYFVLTIQARWLIVLYVIFDMHPILLALSGMSHRSTGIAHAAHLGGLAFGFLYYRFHWKLSGWLPTRGGDSIGRKLTKWWTRPQLRVYSSPPDRSPDRPVERPITRSVTPVSSRDLERRVDEILKKIKEQGEASLSDDERNLLRDASQAYKKRNT